MCTKALTVQYIVKKDSGGGNRRILCILMSVGNNFVKCVDVRILRAVITYKGPTHVYVQSSRYFVSIAPRLFSRLSPPPTVSTTQWSCDTAPQHTGARSLTISLMRAPALTHIHRSPPRLPPFPARPDSHSSSPSSHVAHAETSRYLAWVAVRSYSRQDRAAALAAVSGVQVGALKRLGRPPCRRGLHAICTPPHMLPAAS